MTADETDSTRLTYDDDDDKTRQINPVGRSRVTGGYRAPADSASDDESIILKTRANIFSKIIFT